MLRKESRRRENQIRTLQAENRVKEAVLRRRNEEVTALRSRAKGVLSQKAAGRVPRANNVSFSPKVAKNKWSVIEKNINKVKVNKKAIAVFEKDMERLVSVLQIDFQWKITPRILLSFRLINERESLGKELEQMIRKRDLLRLSRNASPNELQDLEEQIEAGQANMDYIQVGWFTDFYKLTDVSRS